MKIRKSIAVLALAGAASFGYVGVADAQTPAPTPAASTTPGTSTPQVNKHHRFNCDTAKDRLAKARLRDEKLKDRIAKAEARIDKLRKEGHNDRADKLAKRVQAAKDRLTKVEARIDTIATRIHVRCDGAVPVAKP